LVSRPEVLAGFRLIAPPRSGRPPERLIRFAYQPIGAADLMAGRRRSIIRHRAVCCVPVRASRRNAWP
jgi:hypothetical protein